MQRLNLLIGPIASGKSTLTREFAKRGSIIINDDAIVNLVHGGIYGLYTKGLKPLYKGTELYILTTAFGLGRDVVIDRPCFKASTRRRYIEVARAFDVDITGYVMGRFPPEIHAQRRFQSDARGHTFDYWLEVAKAHDTLWDEPRMDEGFSSLIHVDNPADIHLD